MPVILYVDDEPEMITMMQRLLGLHGFEVVGVTSGYAALNMLGEFTPDLIVLDLMMPGLSGEEVFGRIKSDRALRHIPIIILTAATGNPRIERERWLGWGAAEFFSKPVRIADLITAIHWTVGDCHPT